MSCRSNSIFSPRPLHSGQAPKGLLKEKSLGCSSGILIPQSGQAFFWLKKTSCSIKSLLKSTALPEAAIFFITSAKAESVLFTRRITVIIPPALCNAVSIESARRFRTSAFKIILSTTSSIVCFFCLSSFTLSLKSARTPSILARTKPEVRASSRIFWCSPFLPLTTGARIWIFVPGSQLITEFIIWSTDCSWITLPHFGQWARPIRAKSRR